MVILNSDMYYPQTLKVKNGTIELPQSLQRMLEGLDVLVQQDDGGVTLQTISRPTLDVSAWKAAAGRLKGRLIEDPSSWQSSIRKEWDRTLP